MDFSYTWHSIILTILNVKKQLPLGWFKFIAYISDKSLGMVYGIGHGLTGKSTHRANIFFGRRGLFCTLYIVPNQTPNHPFLSGVFSNMD